MSTLRLCLERDVEMFVRSDRGVQPRTFSEIFVLLGTTPAEKDIPKKAGFTWDAEGRRWWTSREESARSLAQFAHNGLRERWGLDASSTPDPGAETVRVVGSQQQEAFWADVQYGSTHLVLEARAGTGKCLGHGTPVLMFDGTIKPVEEICLHDKIMGPDSQPRRVQSLSPATARDKMVRVIPVKGEPFVCTHDHIFTLVNSVTNEVFDVPLDDFLATRGIMRHKDAKLFRVAVDFPAQSVSTDSYLLGLWLGDGSAMYPIITTPDTEIVDYCMQAAPLHGCEAVLVTPPERCQFVRFRIRSNRESFSRNDRHPLRDFFRSCIQEEEKRIPRRYLCNSRESRLDLLAGILDTDGFLSSPNTYEIITKYNGLKDDILFLARSLGFAAYASLKTGTIKSRSFASEYWRISISGDTVIIPCKVQRKKAAARQQKKSVMRTGFRIEPLDEDEYFGFSLDGDGRFLLGDFTVTHNTFSVIEAAKRAREKRIGFSAFNAHIAEELKGKVPPGTKAFTLHSLGGAAVRRYASRVTLDKQKVANLVKEMYPANTKNHHFIGAVSKIVSLCKSYLVDGTDEAQLNEIAIRHDVDVTPPQSDMDKELYRARIFATVPRILETCRAALESPMPTMDYDDMIWLPVVLRLAVENFDLLFVDESQDMNLCQQRLAFMACPEGRIVIVGDPRQSIYAFRGADTRSMARMTSQLRSTSRDCETLPLTFTRRCPKSHVLLAQKIVKDIEAMPEAPEGEIVHMAQEKVASIAMPQEMVICRTNAPLMRLAHELLRAGKKPLMKGRDIGASIRELLKKFNAVTIPELTAKLEEYSRAECARLFASNKGDEALVRLMDRVETLEVLMEGCATLFDLEEKMAQIFDNKDERDAVILASVHSCKGLEADTVYILRPDLMPHPKATRLEDLEQEANIHYVALTRSKNKLVFAHEHYIEPRKESADEDQSELFDDDAMNAESPMHFEPEGYCQTVPSAGLLETAKEREQTDIDLVTGWHESVRALLQDAYERAPFDESEVLNAIETALLEVRRSETKTPN